MSNRETTRSDKNSSKTEYGLNQVFETPSGHQIQLDNTPGNERIFIRHSSGTYMEMSADGKVTSFTVGDQKNYNKAGVTFTVDENSDVKMSGHNRIVTGGGLHSEIAGDLGAAVGGDLALVGMGKVNMRAKQVYFGSDGSLNIRCGGNLNIEADGDIVMRGAKIHLNPV